MALQVVMTFETYWVVLYTISVLLITFYKGKFEFCLIQVKSFLGYGGLVYPTGIWEMELGSIFFFFLLQMMRLDFGKKANRNEHRMATGLFVVFSIFALLIYAYFGFFTTYTLIIEIGFGAFGMFFTTFEILVGFYTLIVKFK